MPITLTVTAGPQAGRRFTFDRHETFLIGRAPEAHFSLPDDDYFSRMHCLLEVNPPRCRLTDLNSRNGTFVNDVRVQTAELRHGDRIRGGKTVLEVTVVSGHPTATLGLVEAKPETELEDYNLATVAPESVAPVIVGYRLVERLGSGAMGTVYRAIRESDEVEVAVKMITSADTNDPVAVKRFMREGALMGQLRHPNVVTYYESGTADRLLYFVMEYVAGMDASRLVKQEGPLPLKRAVRLTLQALLGLDYAHRQGIVHRDVKPANLLVAQAMGRETVKLADFGLARAYQASALSGVTMTGTTGGTPAYLPPEQITDFRTAKPAADQYSAAATLYFLLTGKHGYEAPTTAELFRKVLTEEPVSLRSRRTDVPAALAAVVHRALARRPEDRHADVKALAQALVAFG